MDRPNHNHGTVKDTKDGSIICTSFGKDDSDVTGPAMKERSIKMGGGMTDLSHSLSGTSANQKGA